MRPPFTIAPSPNKFRPNRRDIKALIIHATGTDGIESPIREFLNPETKKSAHWVIGRDGKIVKMVEECDVAYHAGESKWKGMEFVNPTSGKPTMNQCSIGIELVNLNTGTDPYPPAQIDALVLLAAEIVKDYSIILQDVVGHEDIAPGRKVDPGASFPWDEFRSRLQAA